MITKSEQELAQRAMKFALEQGCSACRISLSQAEEHSVEIRNEQIDKVSESVERQMVISLFVEERYGSISTNRLEWDELKQFIANGINATRFLESDPLRTLPQKELYYQGGGDDLDQYDSEIEQLNMGHRIILAKHVIEEIKDIADNIISIESGYSDVQAFNYLIDSQNFEALQQGTNYAISCNVSLMDNDDARPESYWYDSSVKLSNLNTTGIGTMALQRAQQKIGQKKIKAGLYNAIIDREAISKLIRPLIRAMMGQALFQQKSFLINKLGHSIASKKLTLFDVPHQVGSISARYFNNEGIATIPRTLITEGVLNYYLIDPYYGKKIKMEPTINNITLLKCENGQRTKEDICKDQPLAVYITGFNGGNCNPTTGDFSYGVEGILIEKGIMIQPFSEMVFTGNILELWKSLLELSNDTRACDVVQLPSMLFEQISLS